ncbi:MAG: signal peptidase I [Fluviicola sp. XM-24bin1]|nr:MAG: signal peptidase I [Fluviicola sp. XM-24bin1]
MDIKLFYLFLLVHPYLAMWWKSFEQADRKQWEALVPGYNYFIAFRLGAQKPWWSLLLIFPGVHIVMWSVVNLSYVRRFGYFSLIDTVQGIFFPYILMYKIQQSGDKILPETNWANSKEVGEREWGDHLALFLSLPVLGHVIALGFAAISRPKPGKKTKVKEWGDSIWFALVAALVIRTYVFEPFKIPTGSMENTLLVGDFLFVNKVAYGPKVPVTPVSYPLVHNTVPWINIKSYVGLETANYTRLPGYADVNRYDVVVFNYPAGDTSIYDPRMPMGLMGHNYHDYVNVEAQRLWQEQSNLWRQANTKINQLRAKGAYTEEQGQAIRDVAFEDFLGNINKWRNEARELIASGYTMQQTNQGPQMIQHKGIIARPVDKRENYIKRCVGLPGDYLELIDSKLYVNGKPAPIFENQLLKYMTNVTLPGQQESWDKYGIDTYNYNQYRSSAAVPDPHVLVNKLGLAKLKRDFPDSTFALYRDMPYQGSMDSIPATIRVKNLSYFPNDPNVCNTVSDFQKFWIPKKGVTITLTKENIPYYRRIITTHEGHTLKENGDGTFVIDGKKTNKYTFAMNYYWMMGDNRYNSTDARMWGFVPEDHIVGKASMVWYSSGPSGVRWDRLFMGIK